MLKEILSKITVPFIKRKMKEDLDENLNKLTSIAKAGFVAIETLRDNSQLMVDSVVNKNTIKDIRGIAKGIVTLAEQDKNSTMEDILGNIGRIIDSTINVYAKSDQKPMNELVDKIEYNLDAQLSQEDKDILYATEVQFSEISSEQFDKIINKIKNS